MDLEKFGEITFLVENGKSRVSTFVVDRYFCESAIFSLSSRCERGTAKVDIRGTRARKFEKQKPRSIAIHRG